MWHAFSLSIIKWNMYNFVPKSILIALLLVWFRLVVFPGGGGRQQQYWHMPLPSVRARQKWQIVWQGSQLDYVSRHENLPRVLLYSLGSI